LSLGFVFDCGAATGAADARAERWEREARDAFLRGYRAEGDARSRILPASDEGVRALIALFEIEKVFYELAYELNNRPDWAWIPLRGVARLLEVRATADAEARR
jgi:maltose alpha-D-glucosyltransferase/alpha-amylase